MTSTLVAVLVALLFGHTAVAQPTDAAARAALAPSGTLRAAINLGNPVLAQRAPDGSLRGVSVVLARALAERLGVPLDLIPFDSAGQVTDALAAGRWDIAFLARDPVRGQGIAFTDPYVLIEGAFVVRDQSAFRANADVDAPGVTIGVARGSAYDLFLTRALRHATLLRAVTGDDAAAAFLAGTGEVLAGVKSPLVKLVASTPGLRLLPGRFMAIEQTMGTPRDRDPVGLAALQAFMADMKRTGVVARGLNDTGQLDAEVAP